MINLTTLSRPYAKAILEIAEKDNSYKDWSQILELLSMVVKDSTANKFLRNLAIAPQVKADFLCELLPYNQQAYNLVLLLAQAKRLLIMPALYKLYEKFRCKAENIVKINLIVAQETPLHNLEEQFSQKLNCTADMNETTDSKLIAGAVAVIGDRIIDGSIRGRLQALRSVLTDN